MADYGNKLKEMESFPRGSNSMGEPLIQKLLVLIHLIVLMIVYTTEN